MRKINLNGMVKILDTDMVKVVRAGESYILFIRCLDKITWIENHAYPADQRGLIGAMTLAIDVLAGKVMPMQAVQFEDTWPKRELPHSPKLITIIEE